MALRTITGTIKRPGGGTAWSGAVLTFELQTTLLVDAVTIFPGETFTATTNGSGQFSQAVVTPADGEGAAQYTVTLPDGVVVRFNISYSAASVDLAALIAAADLTDAQATLSLRGVIAAYNAEAERWAKEATGTAVVTAAGVVTEEYSAKAWAQEAADRAAAAGAITKVDGTTETTGSAKAWATKIGAAVIEGLYSAMEWAVGDFVPAGSAKRWATSLTTITGGLKGALGYATDAAAEKAAAQESSNYAYYSTTGAKATLPSVSSTGGTIPEGTVARYVVQSGADTGKLQTTKRTAGAWSDFGTPYSVHQDTVAGEQAAIATEQAGLADGAATDAASILAECATVLATVETLLAAGGTISDVVPPWYAAGVLTGFFRHHVRGLTDILYDSTAGAVRRHHDSYKYPLLDSLYAHHRFDDSGDLGASATGRWPLAVAGGSPAQGAALVGSGGSVQMTSADGDILAVSTANAFMIQGGHFTILLHVYLDALGSNVLGLRSVDGTNVVVLSYQGTPNFFWRVSGVNEGGGSHTRNFTADAGASLSTTRRIAIRYTDGADGTLELGVDDVWAAPLTITGGLRGSSALRMIVGSSTTSGASTTGRYDEISVFTRALANAEVAAWGTRDWTTYTSYTP